MDNVSRHRGTERIVSNPSKTHRLSSCGGNVIYLNIKGAANSVAYAPFLSPPHAFHDPGAPGTRARVGRRQTQGLEVVVDKRVEISVRIVLPLVELAHLVSPVVDQNANHVDSGLVLRET